MVVAMSESEEVPPIDTERPEYNLLAAIDGINGPVADLYTDWAWHQCGSAQGIESMRSNLNAIEARVEKARNALGSLEAAREDTDPSSTELMSDE